MPLDPSLIASGVSALGNVAGGLFGNKRNLRNAYNMWVKQQEYNSPSMQMQRLKEAGLNPNLVYGQSSGGAAGNANSAPDAPTVDFGHTGSDFVNSYMAMQMNRSVVDKQAAEVANLEVQNSVLRMDAALRAAQVMKTRAETDKTDLESQKLSATMDDVVKLAALDVVKKEADIRYTNKSAANLDLTAKKIAADTNLSLVQAKKVMAETQRVASEIKRNVAQGNLAQAQKEYYNILTHWYKLGVNPNNTKPLEKWLWDTLSSSGTLDHASDNLSNMFKDFSSEGVKKHAKNFRKQFSPGTYLQIFKDYRAGKIGIIR